MFSNRTSGGTVPCEHAATPVAAAVAAVVLVVDVFVVVVVIVAVMPSLVLSRT